jgi:hypothetical protein
VRQQGSIGILPVGGVAAPRIQAGNLCAFGVGD